MEGVLRFPRYNTAKGILQIKLDRALVDELLLFRAKSIHFVGVPVGPKRIEIGMGMHWATSVAMIAHAVPGNISDLPPTLPLVFTYPHGHFAPVP